MEVKVYTTRTSIQTTLQFSGSILMAVVLAKYEYDKLFVDWTSDLLVVQHDPQYAYLPKHLPDGHDGHQVVHKTEKIRKLSLACNPPLNHQITMQQVVVVGTWAAATAWFTYMNGELLMVPEIGLEPVI
ncbi:hypothetical protein B0H11DRAFT_1918644 [Mycena galericulata]|nr:hypothetical protein B0H11DRAFT_1918644 [Mycena galericulata]